MCNKVDKYSYVRLQKYYFTLLLVCQEIAGNLRNNLQNWHKYKSYA